MERALAWYERSVFRKIILTENSLRAGETACHIRALSCCRVLIYAAIYVIFVVLLDAQVTLCDGERGMVKDDHDHDRIAALFPRVVAEGLAQGMAADVSLDADRVRGGSDHAVRLRARDRGARLFGTRKEKGIPVPVHFGFYQFLAVSCERGPRLMIQQDSVFLSGLLFPDRDVLLYPAVEIDFIVCQVQNVADAQCGVQT